MINDIDFRSMDLGDAWNFFKTEIKSMHNPVYKMARFGINIMFDINEYFMGHIRIKGKTGKVLIRSKAYASEDFYTELEMREREIKKWLIANFTTPDIAKSWEETGMVPRGETQND